MKIESAKFMKGVAGTDDILENAIPHVAFIGRSNVGKSSVINSLTNKKDLAKTSSFPGRTQEINVFLINDAVYLLDLPGYGFARASWETREQLYKLINWYLFRSNYAQKKVVFIVDANVGPTNSDFEILKVLEEYKKNIVIVANKVDKIKSSKYAAQFKKIQEQLGKHKIIPYSSVKKIGIKELTNEILN